MPQAVSWLLVLCYPQILSLELRTCAAHPPHLPPVCMHALQYGCENNSVEVVRTQAELGVAGAILDEVQQVVSLINQEWSAAEMEAASPQQLQAAEHEGAVHAGLALGGSSGGASPRSRLLVGQLALGPPFLGAK